MYSAVNAISGHWVSFGPTTPIPKKRLDLIRKVLLFFSYLFCIYFIFIDNEKVKFYLDIFI